MIHEGVQNKLLALFDQGPGGAAADRLQLALRPAGRAACRRRPNSSARSWSGSHANAQTEEGRRQVSRNTVRQLSQARWDMPTSEGRQREFFNLLIPKLDDPSSDTQWFLAEQLGRILAANPDFRTETLLSMVPKSFASPLEEMFWLPSAGWMLTYDAPLPEVGQSAAADQPQRAAPLRPRPVSCGISLPTPTAACGPWPSRCSISRPSIPAPK